MVTLESILERDNLNRAYKQVKANKGGPGVDGMTVDKFCTLLAKYWGFSGYRLAQTDDAMFRYAQLDPSGGEPLTDFADANSYLTVYFDGDQSGTPMYISLDRFPGRVSVLFGMLHQVG